MRVAVAGIPGAWSTEHLAEALRAEGAESFVFSLGDITHDLVTGSVRLDDRDLAQLDGIVVKKLGDQSNAWSRLRLHPLRALERSGVRVFSPADVIDLAMDRYRMTMVLAQNGLPLPATVAAESAPAVRAAIATIGAAVVKPVYTSKGRGMVRVSGDELPDAVPPAVALDGGRVLVQRFVQAPGRDIGATVIGGKFVGAFYRVAERGEWMTTTARGGRYCAADVDAKAVRYAERAAAAFGLDYTVVDLVETDGDYLLYEVSAFGGFRGLLDASGIDAASDYARYIVRTLAGGGR